MMRLVALLLLTTSAMADEKAIRAAVTQSLPILSKAAQNYPHHRDCFSCHHHALPIMAIQAAQKHGYTRNDLGMALHVKFTLNTFRPNLDEIRQGNRVPGSNTTAAYALHTLQAVQHPRDTVTDALVQFLLVRQTSEGTWPATTQRPPTEGSKFTTAFFALDGLHAYGTEADQPKIDIARTKARTWLEANEPSHTEDTVFRLRALLVVQAKPATIDAARKALQALQQDDGGFAQLPNGKPDAYATGSALVALRHAGMPPTDPVYQRGIAWLLKHQDATGAWLVTTRSRPVQALFDNGDPGGKSQFITVAATGWATLALLEALP